VTSEFSAAVKGERSNASAVPKRRSELVLATQDTEYQIIRNTAAYLTFALSLTPTVDRDRTLVALAARL